MYFSFNVFCAPTKQLLILTSLNLFKYVSFKLFDVFNGVFSTDFGNTFSTGFSSIFRNI